MQFNSSTVFLTGWLFLYILIWGTRSLLSRTCTFEDSFIALRYREGFANQSPMFPSSFYLTYCLDCDICFVRSSTLFVEFDWFTYTPRTHQIPSGLETCWCVRACVCVCKYLGRVLKLVTTDRYTDRLLQADVFFVDVDKGRQSDRLSWAKFVFFHSVGALGAKTRFISLHFNCSISLRNAMMNSEIISFFFDSQEL